MQLYSGIHIMMKTSFFRPKFLYGSCQPYIFSIRGMVKIDTMSSDANSDLQAGPFIAAPGLESAIRCIIQNLQIEHAHSDSSLSSRVVST